MTSRVPVFTILILAAVVAFYFLGERVGQGAAGLTPNGASGGATRTDSPSRLPGAQVSEETPEVDGSNETLDATAPVTASHEDVDGPGERDASEPDSDQRELAWLRRYGDLEVDRLRAELALLQRQFESQRELAFDDLYALDEHKSYGPGEAMEVVGNSSFGTPLLTEMRTVTDPKTLQPSVALLILSQDSHGALYELQAEIAWLEARIGG